MSSHLPSDAPPVTRLLADFVAAVEPAAIPDATRTEAARSFVNWLGCAIGGARHEAVGMLLAAIGPFCGERRFHAPGLAEPLDLFTAALVQGMASHVLDFDDTDLRTIVHPAGPVLSAVLPLAAARGVSGAATLEALVIGVEVECRIANAVFPEHYDVGWHITGTVGVMGAAAAVARLLGLDAARAGHALGIASTQASGFREMFGSMCKGLHVGVAARNGLQAALLAERGFTSSPRAIEAPRGFLHVMSTARRYDAITAGLGTDWQIDRNTYKPFACGIVLHPVIDACAQLAGRHGVPASDVASIELSVHPLVLELTGARSPATGLHSKFSFSHAAAVGYLFGRAAEFEFSDTVAGDPAVARLRDRVSAVVDPAVAEDAARARLTAADGRQFEIAVEHAVGSTANPLTDAALDAKFLSLSEPALGTRDAAAALAAGRAIDRSSDVSRLVAACLPAEPRDRLTKAMRTPA